MPRMVREHQAGTRARSPPAALRRGAAMPWAPETRPESQSGCRAATAKPDPSGFRPTSGDSRSNPALFPASARGIGLPHGVTSTGPSAHARAGRPGQGSSGSRPWRLPGAGPRQGPRGAGALDREPWKPEERHSPDDGDEAHQITVRSEDARPETSVVFSRSRRSLPHGNPEGELVDTLLPQIGHVPRKLANDQPAEASLGHVVDRNGRVQSLAERKLGIRHRKPLVGDGDQTGRPPSSGARVPSRRRAARHRRVPRCCSSPPQERPRRSSAPPR
jgi:hypothetical protein